MRTVAISTMGKSFLLTNYGSFFQHYALRKVLKNIGYMPFRVHPSKEHVTYLQLLLGTVFDCLRPLVWYIKRVPHVRALLKTALVRDALQRKFLLDFERLIGPIDEAQPYDEHTCGILGGDQVLCTKDTPDEWLHKVDDSSPIITYAVSSDWASNENSAKWRDEINRELARFSAVGIRERRGVDLVKNLVKPEIDVRHVADPVQLLTVSDFRAIQSKKPVFQERTLFCYLLNVQTAADMHLAEYEQLAEKLNCDLRILGLQGAELFVPRKYRILLSPREFLRSLDDATYFITNSYHGSVLAMLYHKDFLSVKQRCTRGKNQNERQGELLTEFNLKGCWQDFNYDQALIQLTNFKADWLKIDNSMASFRTESLAWLKNALA